jgi:hypothetical protein
MVLDAPLEHSQPEGAQVTDELMAAEESFNRFARWCDTAPTCVLRGQDVAAVFVLHVARAHETPWTPTSSGPRHRRIGSATIDR